MSVLSTESQKQVEDLLVQEGLLTAPQLASLRDKAKKDNVPFFSVLVGDGHVTNEQLTKTIAKVANIPYVNLTGVRIEPDVLTLLPRDIAERYMAVPLGEMQHRLVVAMLDAGNVQAVDFLAGKIGRPLKVYAASEEGIREVISQYAGAAIGKEMSEALENAQDVEELTKPVDRARAQIESIVQDSPISKALSAILEYAVKNRASDIHVEPFESELKIRCRIDGVLKEIMKLPKTSEPPLVSRIKILANLKIDEHRIPQDGQFTIHVANRDVDLRIAISPVVWGEQVVIRLLDKTGTRLKLEEMGYRGRTLQMIRQALKGSNGMVLTSGPTGSGKSTSMYSLLQEIKDESLNIVTLEDPVEYKIGGVNQIQVNNDVGLTFSTGLRSILRQDPNVIMVGEIRDKETAQLAVQAALTGHLVFSTLHTNSAAGILPRLLDMGIEPFLIASTVRMVIGQRLVRRLSEKGRETYQGDAAEAAAVNAVLGNILPATAADIPAIAKDLGYESLPLRGQNAYTLYKGTDSPSAPQGFKGRMGLYEAFPISPSIRNLIMKQATSAEIQQMASREGMISMREDGYLKALAGFTTITEVDRVAAADSA